MSVSATQGGHHNGDGQLLHHIAIKPLMDFDETWNNNYVVGVITCKSVWHCNSVGGLLNCVTCQVSVS